MNTQTLDRTIELAQKLFNEAGHPGNLYKNGPEVVRLWENKALEIIEGE